MVPRTFEDIANTTTACVGYVLLDPFREKTNPQYKSDYYSYFTLVVKGKYVQKFTEFN